MPFDLARAHAKLRQCHGDPLAFRFAMLDLLFAVGGGAREQAVASPWGDALCLRTSGPAAPVPGRRMLLVVADLELPGPNGADPAARWPARMSGLGGPAAGLAWATALHALLGRSRQQPWELVFLRAPAFGAAEFLAALTEAKGADVALLLPVSAEAGSDLDLARLELQRPRNIWRFPACDHTATLHGKAPLGQAWPALRQVMGSLPTGATWTLHDLRIAAGDGGAFTAVLRSSAPAAPTAAVACQPAAADLRLLFPVNDALATLGQIGDALPAAWQAALQAPIGAHTVPDGLWLQLLGPALADEIELPDRAGTLAAHWDVAPLSRTFGGTARPLGVQPDHARGSVPAGLSAAAQLWYAPDFAVDGDAQALSRALAAALDAS